MAADHRQRGALGRVIVRRLLAVLLLSLTAAVAMAAARWLALAADGLHDPRGPAIGLLQ